MNQELLNKLAKRRQWEDKPETSPSRSPPPPPPPSSGQGSQTNELRRSPPPPPPPPPPQTSSGASLLPPPPPIPTTDSNPNKAPSPSPIQSQRTSLRNSANRPLPPGRIPSKSRGISSRSLANHVPPPPPPPIGSRIENKSIPPPPLQSNGEQTGALQKQASSGEHHPPSRSPPRPGRERARERAPSPDSSAGVNRGQKDFNRKRPDSSKFTRPLSGNFSEKESSLPPPPPPPLPRNSSRPLAPSLDMHSSRNITHGIDANSIPVGTKHDLALKGKEILHKTFSSDMPAANVVRSARSGSKDSEGTSLLTCAYIRVNEDFIGSDSSVLLYEDDVVEISSREDPQFWTGRVWQPLAKRAEGEFIRFPPRIGVPIKDPDDPWDEGDPNLVELDPEAEKQRKEEEAKVKAMKELHKKWRDRNRLFLALLELLTNEFRYVASLMVCSKVYISTIESEKDFGAEFVASLFPTWDKLKKTHEEMLIELVKASKKWWDVLLHLPGVKDPSEKRSSSRESILTSLNGVLLPGSINELNAIGQELDNVQRWHDNCVLDKEDSLSNATLEAYTQALGNWAVALSNMLRDICPSLKESSVYIRNHSDALKKLDEWSRTFPKFGEKMALLSQNPLVRGLSLNAYLIKPVQQICRYPLLIREVHKYSPDESTQEAVNQCQIRLIEVTTEVNSMQKEFETEARMSLDEIRGMMKYKPATLEDVCNRAYQKPTTQLMKYGILEIKGGPADGSAQDIRVGSSDTVYMCILLNSILMISEKYQNFLGKDRLRTRVVVDLNKVGLVSIVPDDVLVLFGVSCISKADRNPLEGNISSKPHKWVFCCKTPKERDSWIRNIEQALSITRAVHSNKSDHPPMAGEVPMPSNALTHHASMLGLIQGSTKYDSQKARNEQLRNSEPDDLMNMQNNDPYLRELREKLLARKTKLK